MIFLRKSSVFAFSATSLLFLSMVAVVVGQDACFVVARLNVFGVSILWLSSRVALVVVGLTVVEHVVVDGLGLVGLAVFWHNCLTKLGFSISPC